MQGDTPDVLSVLLDHLPIQLATQYGEKMCLVKHHISEDKSSIIESSGGVQTLHNVSPYHEPAWHFDAKFVDRQPQYKGKRTGSLRSWTLFGDEELGVPLSLRSC